MSIWKNVIGKVHLLAFLVVRYIKSHMFLPACLESFKTDNAISSNKRMNGQTRRELEVSCSREGSSVVL